MDKIQELHFELLKMLRFPNLDGEQVATDLFAHPELWNAVYVVFKWEIDPKQAPGLFWHFSGIFIFTVPGREDDLYRLAESWNPDNIDFTSENGIWKDEEEEPFTTFDQKALDNEKLYLEVWWNKTMRIPADTHPNSFHHADT